MKTTANSLFIILISLFISTGNLSAQGFKDKMKNKLNKAKPEKDRSAMYECGYVKKEKKVSMMKGLQKVTGKLVTSEGFSDLGRISASVYYQAHWHPEEIMRFPTETKGWETCGDAVFLGMTNRSGMGLAYPDGKVTVNGEELEKAGIGTFFQGFSPDKRGEKEVTMTSSDGDKVTVTVGPAAELEIKSIDGKAKGETVVIDGSKDIVVELINGDADPQSQLHVSMVGRSLGRTPIMYDVIVVRPKNRIIIPKDAFFNFEGSPTPFFKENTLVINRVREEILDNTDFGAVRTLSCYMDWMPVEVEGQIAKGSIMTSGFDTTRNTNLDVDLRTEGEYNFMLKKAGPYTSPPVKLIKNVAVASFVVRGNLEDKETTTTHSAYTITTTTITKWFPEVSKESWQALSDRLYTEFAGKLQNDMGYNVLPLNDVTGSKAYKYAKTIKDDVTKNFVEVGAGGTKRILTTSTSDLFADLSITFPGDFVSERLVKELGVDAVVAVTIDLNFDFETEGLNPKVSIEFFAPNVSHKTAAKYFSASASTKARSLEEAKKYSGGATNQLYQMIKGDVFMEEFINAMNKLKVEEDKQPVYESLWKAKL